MAEGNTVSLGEVVDILTGNPFKSAEYVEGSDNPKLLRGDNIAQGTLRWDNVKRWPSGKSDGLERYVLRAGDIVLAMDRPWIEAGLKYACLSEHDLPAFLVQRVARMRGTERLRTDFLRYLIGSGAFTAHVLGVQTGTAVPHISARQIKSFEFDLPTLEDQESIAACLGSFDDKIELNRRMNETLEEMARVLFRDWFVDFGPTRRQMEGATDPAAIIGHAFPPEKATTLEALFPAKMDAGGLPEGWEKRPLDEIGHFLNGLALQKFPAQDGKPDLPVIKIAELRNGVTAKSNRASTDVPEKYVIGNGDFIFSWSGSLMAKFWTGGAGALNQHLFKVTSESHPMWFVSEWVQTHLEEFQRIAASKAVTMGHIKRSHLAEAMCVCPAEDVLTVLGEVFDPLTAKQIANYEENQTLAEMRDLLLPKLMSGEIRLKDVEAGL